MFHSIMSALSHMPEINQECEEAVIAEIERIKSGIPSPVIKETGGCKGCGQKRREFLAVVKEEGEKKPIEPNTKKEGCSEEQKKEFLASIQKAEDNLKEENLSE